MSESKLAFLAPLCAIAIFFGVAHAGPGWIGPGVYVALPLIVHLSAAVCCLAAILFMRSDRMHPPWGGTIGLPVVVLFLHGIILYFTLNYAAPSQWLIWGTFFIGDAADFYWSAVRLLWDGEFYTPRGRPVANSLVASLSAVTHFSVHAIVAINLLLAAIALWLMGLITWSTHGPVFAVIFCAVLFDFTLDHGVTVSSELMGFVIGACAFVLLWRAAAEKRAALFLLGMLALSVAMVVRVGALFVLPALLLWAVRYPFAEQGARWRLAGAGLAVVLTVFAVNSIVTKQITPNAGGGFVNAAKSWYAVFANGREALGITPSSAMTHGARWTQIYKDNPELRALPPSERVSRELALTIEQARRYPLAGLVGVWLEFKDFFLLQGMLNFVENKWARHAYFILAAIGGFAALLRARHDAFAGLLLFGNLGIFLSVPFLHGGVTRVLAGTMGFTAALSAFGALVIVNALMRRSKREDWAHLAVAGKLASGLSILVFVGVVLLSALSLTRILGFEYSTPETNRCRPDERPLALHYAPGSSIQVVPNSLTEVSRLPVLRVADVRHTIARWQAEKLSGQSIGRLYYDATYWRWFLEMVEENDLPLTFIRAPDSITGHLVPVVVPGWKGPISDGMLRVCSKDKNGRLIARAESIEFSEN